MFDQKKYIKDYNKDKYKMYQFRVKKSDTDLVNHLNTKNNKSGYIVDLIGQDLNKRSILTIKQIRKAIKPILNKHGITDIYLFGSYARGEATTSSDVDIYCDKGDVKTLFDATDLDEELQSALGKKVDVVFTSSQLHPYFKEQIMEDLIKLC